MRIKNVNVNKVVNTVPSREELHTCLDYLSSALPSICPSTHLSILMSILLILTECLQWARNCSRWQESAVIKKQTPCPYEVYMLMGETNNKQTWYAPWRKISSDQGHHQTPQAKAISESEINRHYLLKTLWQRLWGIRWSLRLSLFIDWLGNENPHIQETAGEQQIISLHTAWELPGGDWSPELAMTCM